MIENERQESVVSGLSKLNLFEIIVLKKLFFLL